MLAAGDRYADLAPVPVRAPDRRRDARRVQRGDRLGGERHVLAEERSQRAVVGLDLVAAQLLGSRHEAHGSHVELVANDLGEAFDRLALAAARNHDRLGERLAHLDLRLAPRSQTQPHRLARQRHRLLELRVARRDVVRRRPPPRKIAQVHAGE